MKKTLALILICALLLSCLSGCGTAKPAPAEELNEEAPTTGETVIEEAVATSIPGNDFEERNEEQPAIQYNGLDDPELLRHIEDQVYEELVNTLDSDQYFVENVEAVYVSKEYLEEINYNSQANVYFGYTLEELENLFQGKKYVFTLGEDGQTTVKEFEEYVNPYLQALKNVAIGSGVIIICVTVAVVSGAVGAPAISMIFWASAKSATTFALYGGIFSAVSAGVVEGIETGDLDKALQAAALAGSEGFKWGAITGAISGGATEALALKGATLNGLTMNEAAWIQKETKWPLSIIKNISSPEEYLLYKEAGLTCEMVGQYPALIQNIDLSYKSELGGKTVTNLQRMQKGYAPLDPKTGAAYELHHVGQAVDSPLAILTPQQHRFGESYSILHDPTISSGTGVHAQLTTAEWNAQRSAFWKAFSGVAG